jgi:hypothetical protein
MWTVIAGLKCRETGAGSPNRSFDTTGLPRGGPPPFSEDRGQGTYPPLSPVLALPLHTVSPMRTPRIRYRPCTTRFGRKTRAGLSHSRRTQPRLDGGHTSGARRSHHSRVLLPAEGRRGPCRPGGACRRRGYLKNRAWGHFSASVVWRFGKVGSAGFEPAVNWYRLKAHWYYPPV